MKEVNELATFVYNVQKYYPHYEAHDVLNMVLLYMERNGQIPNRDIEMFPELKELREMKLKLKQARAVIHQLLLTKE